ncbi:IS1249 family transposase [Corynebacterium amycolatum]|uniref:IS1249 family transposase n=6 Tax=Actinomycetes TaxID=1760 RepID=UPI00191E8EC5|nr:IS1249 family transposase [Corynebacterium amycolatum]QQU99117.1 IS1249 family transposase [Corynebacterium amycolatum]
MSKNQPRCHCGGEMKRNGTTSKGTTRWRCKQCGASSVKRRNDITNAAVFTQFIEHCTTAISLDDLAKRNGVSRATMKRRFKWCWLVDVPDPTAGHHKRIYDQVFLDGTYTAGGCLIVAATIDHVIAWHWCKHETTRDYQLLLERIEAPLIAVIDGGQGAYSAIKKCWPTTKIQRCLVHAQRTVRRHTTSNPRTDAGKTLYRLALKLTRITDLDQASTWVAHLHEFDHTYREWMNEKTTIKDPATGAYTKVYTHQRVRAAYQSLLSLHRRDLLFTYLQPPPTTIDPDNLAATTNSLEGGINAPIKELARRHRGLSLPHQRTVMDWWLYLHTEVPDDPVKIARDQRWGQDALSTATDLITHNTTATTNDIGAPAEYDTAIDTSYQHNLGIQKGWIK